MQDRFKFRIFDKINKVMRYNDFILTSNGYTGELLDLNTSEDENTLFIMRSLDTYKRYSEPMQCTGLKDKNSKLIYEGDIVNLKNTRLDFEETHVVMFKDCAFQFSFPNSTQIDRPLYCWAINYLNHYKHIELEVIGNIYETPELLEDK